MPSTQQKEFKLETLQLKQRYNIDKAKLLSPTATNKRKQELLGKHHRGNPSQITITKSGRKLQGKTLDCSFVQEKCENFKSLREKVDNFFQEETYSCQRSSTKKRRRLNEDIGNGYDPCKLTKPQSPSFQTDKRLQLKPQQVLSSEEMVLLEIKKKGSFKARPLKKKIFMQPVGIPTKMERAATTEFKEFSLNTAQRQNRVT